MREPTEAEFAVISERHRGLIREGWVLVAVTAWTGYEEHGRGMVVFEEGDNSLYYWSWERAEVWAQAAGKPELLAEAKGYDPARQVVVLAVSPENTSSTLHLIEDQPPPPICVAMAMNPNAPRH